MKMPIRLTLALLSLLFIFNVRPGLTQPVAVNPVTLNPISEQWKTIITLDQSNLAPQNFNRCLFRLRVTYNQQGADHFWYFHNVTLSQDHALDSSLMRQTFRFNLSRNEIEFLGGQGIILPPGQGAPFFPTYGDQFLNPLTRPFNERVQIDNLLSQGQLFSTVSFETLNANQPDTKILYLYGMDGSRVALQRKC